MANFQIVLDQQIGDEVCKNVTYWQLPDNQSATLQTFADNLRGTFVTPDLVGWLATSWTLLSITARQMDGGGAFSQLVTFGLGPLVGGAVGQQLPTQLALLVSTGFLGPKPNRGRIYFGGLVEDANSGTGQPVLDARDDFQTAVEVWRDGVATGAGNAFLRIARPDFLANDWILNNPVESVIARNIWGGQRRRRIGVGA